MNDYERDHMLMNTLMYIICGIELLRFCFCCEVDSCDCLDYNTMLESANRALM